MDSVNPRAAAADQEGASDRAPTLQLVLELARLAWPLRYRFVVMALLTLVRAGLMSACVFALQRAVNTLVESQGADIRLEFFAALVILLLCQLLAALALYYGDQAERWFTRGVEVAAFEWVVGNLFSFPADYFRTRPVLQYVQRLVRLQTSVRSLMTSTVTIGTRLCVIAGILAGIVWNTPLFTFLAIGALGIVGAYVWRRTLRLRRLAIEEMEQETGFVEQLLTVLTNLRDLHGLGLREQAQDQFARACDAYTQRRLRMARLQQGIGATVNVAGILLLAGLLGVVLVLGADQVASFASFVALGLILQPISEIVRAQTGVQMQVTKLDTLFQRQHIKLGKARIQQSGTEELAEQITHLQFEGVGYATRRGVILEGLSFELHRGEIIGIVGRSGAGKTTLGNLLLRLIDHTAGTVKANGRTISEFELASYWEQASAITQVPYRIEGSLAEEIALAWPAATREAILAAALEAGLDPSLLDTGLEASGWRSAGGAAWHTRSLQQRVEWARLWLRPASLVVLDEPTSLADPVHEQRFIQSLLRRRQGWITVLISHRPATLAICDRLIVLDRGRLVAVGPRTDLASHWLAGLDSEEARAS